MQRRRKERLRSWELESLETISADEVVSGICLVREISGCRGEDDVNAKEGAAVENGPYAS
ncbi:hypothetical protein C5167_049411 [Papaver somniferum]|uniref:Uncharacterized protein n=1 Tax=Papaver somniferum TaxID=3469 RepID=A0A4Y7KNH2_PAPSO|nr:hypothetical protein C5167_049411 [Papaver somniferum]